MADKRIKDLTNTAAESDIASGNYFVLDGSAGTKKLNSTTLLELTAQNALGSIHSLSGTATDFASDDYLVIDGTTNGSRKIAKNSLINVLLSGNIVQAFDATRDSSNPYKVGESVIYNGSIYTFKNQHYGAWSASDVRLFSIDYLIRTLSDKYKAIFYHKNLLDKNDADALDGYYISPNNGVPSASPSYDTTGYIPVVAGVSYKASSNPRTIAFYDINKTFISGINYPDATFTAPFAAAYIRLSFADLNKVFAEESHFDASNTTYDNTAYIDSALINFEDLESDILTLLTSEKYIKEKDVLFLANLFNINDADIELDKVFTSPTNSDSTTSNNAYNITGYLEIDPNVNYLSSGVIRDYVYYDANKNFLGGSATETSNFTIADSKARYVRLAMYKSGWNNLVVCRSECYTGAYTPYSSKKFVRTDLLYNKGGSSIVKGLTFEGAVAYNTIKYFSVNICKSFRLSAEISGTFDAVSFGLGFLNFYGKWIEVDATNVYIKHGSSGTIDNTYAHGLTIDSETKLVLVGDGYEGSAVFELYNSKMDKFSQNISWGVNVGNPFIRNESASGTFDTKFNFVAGDLSKLVWIFGDSYLSFNDPARWLYHIKSLGLKNYLLDAIGGETAATSLIDLSSLFSCGGMPKKILWCLGMNGGTDAVDGPNASWLTATQSFLTQCDNLGIEAVLMTIPSVPSLDHSKKSNWVRNSGYRYVDAAAAVEKEGTSTWQNWGTANAFLSPDEIHPTLYGARAIANKVLADFPEISFA